MIKKIIIGLFCLAFTSIAQAVLKIDITEGFDHPALTDRQHKLDTGHETDRCQLVRKIRTDNLIKIEGFQAKRQRQGQFDSESVPLLLAQVEFRFER